MELDRDILAQCLERLMKILGRGGHGFGIFSGSFGTRKICCIVAWAWGMAGIRTLEHVSYDRCLTTAEIVGIVFSK